MTSLKVVNMATLEEAFVEPADFELAEAVSEMHPVDQAEFFNSLSALMFGHSITQSNMVERMVRVFDDETGGLDTHGELFFDVVAEAWEEHKRERDSKPAI